MAVDASTLAPSAPPSPWVELWRDFRRNRGAIIGMAIVVALLLTAALADVIAPY